MRVFKLVLPFVTVLLTACHTMSLDECQKTNWYQLGYNEGYNEEKNISQHQKACNRFSITPDFKAYNKGHQQGYDDFLASYCDTNRAYHLGRKGKSYRDICPPHLRAGFMESYHDGFSAFKREYCSAHNGYRLGRKGQSYRDICPPHLEVDFLASYHRGLEIYELKQEVKKLNEQAKAREEEIKNLRHKQAKTDQAYEIDKLLEELEDLHRERRAMLSRMVEQ